MAMQYTSRSDSALTRFICITIACSSAQKLGTNPENPVICKDIECSFDTLTLTRLKDCVVVLGNLRIFLMEKTNITYFPNYSFPNLREVTGYLLIHRVFGVQTLGNLFPNLARIRGAHLIDNYGLIVYDMPKLKEIGLYSLLKIDRGGVIIWGGPRTCYARNIDWNTIAPEALHVLTPPAKHIHCNMPCNCSTDASTNYCWNSQKCQRFLTGPRRENCNEQCLGCLRNQTDVCSVCRHYTHQGICVPRCPDDTIILRVNKYCLTIEECEKLKGWAWNHSCVFRCPMGYVNSTDNGTTICKRWTSKLPENTCQDLNLHTLNATQHAERCIYVNGSLTIHIRSVPGAMEELRSYLSHIQEVTDYVLIYGSITITSLDFLSSLKRIGGKNLTATQNTYSLIIYNMKNLHNLFTANVTKNLTVARGKLKVYGNPKLCISKIDELEKRFPETSNETDIPPGMNGYSGGCEETPVDMNITVVNETTAIVTFTPLNEHHKEYEYTVLYLRLPPGTRMNFVPETCSESEWFAVHAPTAFDHQGVVELTSLYPASTYVVCIETNSYSYDPLQIHVARSLIKHFTTPVGKPQPPFITELVASSSEVVLFRWIDHNDYRPHITRYELDVTLIEIYEKDLKARDHCNNMESDVVQDLDYSRHFVVMKPPPDYDRGCEPTCGTFFSTVSAIIKDSTVEEYFDICSSLDSECDNYETAPPGNSSFGKYIRTMFLNISHSSHNFKVDNLAPFRDYRFRLRACVDINCSRSTRRVVRTLRSEFADIASITHYSVNDAGHISVKWEPPNITNGPVLAYSVHVMPLTGNKTNQNLPRSWCVSGDEFSMTVKSEITTKRLLRVCSSTLGSFSECSEWKEIVMPEGMLVIPNMKNSWLWSAVFFSAFFIVVSSIIGYLWTRRSKRSDEVLLLDMAWMYTHESEPPILTEIPLYAVPLRETVLDY